MAQQWYVIHAYSGFEKKVAGSIREQARAKGLDGQIADVLVPTEEVVEMRRGQKVNAERKFFPGYVLINMELTDDTWHLVQNTPKVTGFLGGGGKPVPITEREARQILQQVQEGVERPKPSVTFEIGEQVRVCDGPFENFNGMVEEVDEASARASRFWCRFSAGRLRSNWNTPRSKKDRRPEFLSGRAVRPASSAGHRPIVREARHSRTARQQSGGDWQIVAVTGAERAWQRRSMGI